MLDEASLKYGERRGDPRFAATAAYHGPQFPNAPLGRNAFPGNFGKDSLLLFLEREAKGSSKNGSPRLLGLRVSERGGKKILS